MQSLLNFRPNREYICYHSGLAWLKLDLKMPVPVNDIFNEYLNCSNDFVNHRSHDTWAKLSHKGWKSAVIYGVDTATTEETNSLHDWTELSHRCPLTTQWIKDNFIINSSTGRIRFMLLEPGGYILPHSDRQQPGLQEINVAITQPKGCCFRFLDKGTVPFSEGDAFILDTSNRHLVWNNSDQFRLHIILHTKVDDKILEDSYANCFYST